MSSKQQQPQPQKRPSQARSRPPDNRGNRGKEEEQVLTEKLNLLQTVLKKSFKTEFIDSLTSLIRLENQSQSQFDSSLDVKNNVDKVQHFLLQLKKIVKQKSQLMELINLMCIQHRSEQPSASSTTTSSSILSEFYSQKRDESKSVQLDLVNEVSRFDSKDEYFQLVGILVRLLFKLFKHSIMVRRDKKLVELELLLSSCLADLSFYEEIRSSVNDSFTC